MVRWEFNAWGGKYEDQIADGHIPTDITGAGSARIPTRNILEGGSIDANGRGTVPNHPGLPSQPNRNPKLTLDEIEDYLKEYLGAVKIIWLNRGVAGDDTDGHIDDIARFVSPSTIVCAYEENPADENYAVLKENYEILTRATDQENKPFTIVKLPMPAPIMSGDERFPASSHELLHWKYRCDHSDIW